MFRWRALHGSEPGRVRPAARIHARRDSPYRTAVCSRPGAPLLTAAVDNPGALECGAVRRTSGASGRQLNTRYQRQTNSRRRPPVVSAPSTIGCLPIQGRDRMQLACMYTAVRGPVTGIPTTTVRARRYPFYYRRGPVTELDRKYLLGFTAHSKRRSWP